MKDDTPIPTGNEPQPTPIIQDPQNPWLPGTDWSRDGIIAKQTP